MATIIPTFRYDDARAALNFLRDAFGFEEHAVHADGDGVVRHAELKLSDSYIMISQAAGESSVELPYGATTIYVVVDDPDAHHDHAVAAGAEIVMELTDQEYGSREYAAKDPGGNAWCFGTYAPR
ncbi:MAG TPA: VOC family protein [Baekduia sp.]|nr:VOC family protein [Baekduia sp.]